MKQRLRGGTWKTVEEFKAAIQAAWDSINIAQIRRRIREMPWRCKRIQELEGARIFWWNLIAQFGWGWPLRRQFLHPVLRHAP